MAVDGNVNGTAEASEPVFGTVLGTTVKKDDPPARETWSNKIQFLLGCMGFSIGLGNVWRFPYLCYRDGGGAFLIPYVFSVVVGAIPMAMMEFALGQYTGQGVLTCWNIVPILKGIGMAIQATVFLKVTYYNVVMGWSLHYLFASFTKVLPWSSCGNTWNTEYCRETTHIYKNLGNNVTSFMRNTSSMLSTDPLLVYERENHLEEIGRVLGRNTTNVDIMIINGSVAAIDPVNEYWQHKVLAISEGIHDIGTIQWDLALCLLLAWVVVYFAIFKGIKWTGKIMYVSTTSPYLFMLVLLIRGVTLPGAADGIKYYLYPDIQKLKNLRVWYGAATQVFYSYSMACGSLITLGSYNKFHHNFWKDGILFVILNAFTSLLAGFIIFSILGFMSHLQQVSIDQVAESGPGLAFIAYPKAVAELPGAPIWSVLFFIMLFLLGMDSQFGSVEVLIAGFIDAFPRYLRQKYRREMFVAFVCLLCYIMGLSMCTNAGMYIFLLFDNYGQAKVLVILALFEVIAIAWVYGAQRFIKNIEQMLGRKLWPLFKYFLMFITPIYEVVIIVLCFQQYSHVTYNRTYTFPLWSITCGWMVSLAALAVIPIVAVVKIIQAEGTLWQRLQFLSKPQITRRNDAEEKEGKEEKEQMLKDPTAVKLELHSK